MRHRNKVEFFTLIALLLAPLAELYAYDVPAVKQQVTLTIVTDTPSAGDSTAAAIKAFEQELRRKLDSADKNR